MAHRQNAVTRRDLLRAGLAGAGAALAGFPMAADAQRRRRSYGSYGPFRVGLQSYSLRNFPLGQALDMTQRLGLHYWEAVPNHIPMTDSPGQVQDVLAQVKARSIDLVGWGVTAFDANEANARRTFDFARLARLSVISADPTPDSLAMLSKLADQYKINVAIHNHGPGSRYDKIADVSKAMEGQSPRIGACIDTGHFLRSGEDPVEALRVFGKRTHLVHIKDVRNKTEFTEIGRGDLQTTSFFRLLRQIGYKGMVALEYEEHPEAPGPYIDICLAAIRDAIEKALYIKPAS